MNLAIPPPTMKARLHGPTDLVISFCAAILSIAAISWILPILQKEVAFSVGWWFLAVVVALFGFLLIGGLLAPFYRLHISESEIAYGLIHLRRIQWASVTEFRYLGLVPNMGFTERAFFRTEEGKTYIVPIADEKLRAYFNGMQNYKK